MVRFTLAVVLAVVAYGATTPLSSAQDEKKKDRKDKILAALKQCGDTCYSATSETLADSESVLKIVQKGKGDLSHKFPLAAKTMIKNNPKAEEFSILFFPPKNFTSKQLLADLGKPDSTFKAVIMPAGQPVNIEWQWYDWCAFGVGDGGQIIGLAADLKKVKAEEKK